MSFISGGFNNLATKICKIIQLIASMLYIFIILIKDMFLLFFINGSCTCRLFMFNGPCYNLKKYLVPDDIRGAVQKVYILSEHVHWGGGGAEPLSAKKI